MKPPPDNRNPVQEGGTDRVVWMVLDPGRTTRCQVVSVNMGVGVRGGDRLKPTRVTVRQSSDFVEYEYEEGVDLTREVEGKKENV